MPTTKYKPVANKRGRQGEGSQKSEAARSLMARKKTYSDTDLETSSREDLLSRLKHDTPLKGGTYTQEKLPLTGAEITLSKERVRTRKHQEALALAEKTSVLASYMAKKGVTPEEIAHVRKKIFHIVNYNVGQAEKVLSGEIKWDSNQTRIFGMLLDRVIPKVSHTHTTVDISSKPLHELSRSEIESLLSQSGNVIEQISTEASVIEAAEESSRRSDETRILNNAIDTLIDAHAITATDKIAKEIAADLAKKRSED